MNFLEAQARGAPASAPSIWRSAATPAASRAPSATSSTSAARPNVYVRTDLHGLLTVRRFEHRYAVDETVYLTPDPTRALHFADDGRRLAA
jgi:hypothetical protein